MRRRLTHTPHFTALVLILTLTISFIAVLPAKSPNATANPDTAKIVPMLELLRGNVTKLDDEAFGNTSSASGRRTALGNKINATIHQIEAYIKSGSKTGLSGPLNKLQNDVNKTVAEWIYPYNDEVAESLFDLILEIIELIRGVAPPSPDFFMEASSTSLTIALGESDSSIITITSLNDFSELIDLTVSGVPSDVTTTLDPAQVTPPPDGYDTSTLTVSVDISATQGIHILTVTGTSGSLKDSIDITLEITELPLLPDFSIEVSPPFMTIAQGGSDTSIITVTSINGFSNLVTLTVSPAIDGVTYSLDPSAVTPQADGTIISTIAIAVAETATLNSYVLALTGTSGDLQHSTSLSLEITTAPLPPDVEPPTVRIDEPENGSILAGVVDIVVFMFDENFKRAELTINDTLIALWAPQNVSTGEHSISWDTTLSEYPDGLYNIALSAEDEAGNISEKTIKVIVDNTSPIIEAAAWKPKEPSTDEQVNVTVKVSDSQPGSGIQNVTLWYKNTTMNEWHPILMSLNVTSGNWTASIPAQSVETTIKFYIEALDNAGNKAISDDIHEYEVIAPAGIPLAWIIAIILLILAATAAAIYFWRKRRKEKQDTSSGRVKDYKLTLLLCF